MLLNLHKGKVHPKSVRMALGALIIKEKCGYSDRETVGQIMVNPYLQYFIGLKEFQFDAPFNPSLMVHFRKRLELETMKQINEMICQIQSGKNKQETNDDNSDDEQKPGNSQNNSHQSQSGKGDGKKESEPKVNKAGHVLKGKLILDATCAPADMRYPTDLSLLNEGREKLETMIDTLHAPLCGEVRKLRTYRQRARKNYLSVAKCRKNSMKRLPKAVGKQLRYVARDLRIIDSLLMNP